VWDEIFMTKHKQESVLVAPERQIIKVPTGS